MTSNEIREKFLKFFEDRGHKIIPSSSLIPDDKSVLLTTAGMQQFKPYFIGDKDPIKDFGSRRTASIQKSFRTSDIDEVGDESHLTFFEMLGHFSFGDYFKKETIEWTFELLTKVFGIAPERISASVFEGDQKIPKDQESYSAWSRFLPSEKIKLGKREDGNVWGPAGPEGPCGACNEVYVDGLEVATLVFMEYFYSRGGVFTPLKQKGVDVGWGLERLAMIIQGKKNVFETDLFEPFRIVLSASDGDIESGRIIADHFRGIVFLIADGVTPSNKEVGYVLRKLVRRAMVHASMAEIKENIFLIPKNIILDLLKKVINFYGKIYDEINKQEGEILRVFKEEFDNFAKTLPRGLKKFDKIYPGIQTQQVGPGGAVKLFITGKKVGKDAFDLNQNDGLPIEVIKELLERRLYDFDEVEFRRTVAEELYKHQEISRAGKEKKFGGVGKEAGEKEARLHTATHLLHQALRDVLGGHVKQMGSDITSERLRFDFSHTEKMTPEQIKKIEDIVNEKIKENLPVVKKEMSYEEAIKSGALAFFKEKYPEKVSVYSIGAFSKEICAGPHAKKTGELGKFEIIKEESSGAGVRRIRATLNSKS